MTAGILIISFGDRFVEKKDIMNIFKVHNCEYFRDLLDLLAYFEYLLIKLGSLYEELFHTVDHLGEY